MTGSLTNRNLLLCLKEVWAIKDFCRAFHSLSMLVAIIGTTLSAYLYSWQSNQEVEEGITLGRLRLTDRIMGRWVNTRPVSILGWDHHSCDLCRELRTFRELAEMTGGGPLLEQCQSGRRRPHPLRLSVAAELRNDVFVYCRMPNVQAN